MKLNIPNIFSNKLAKNSAILFVGTTVVNGLNYVFHLAIGRLVSVGAYGEIEALISLMNIISVPALAVTMIATQVGSYYKSKNDSAANGFFLKLLNRKIILYGVPTLLLLIGASPLVAGFLKIDSSWAIIIVWFSMLLSFFLAVNGGILTGWQKFSGLNWVGIFGAGIKLVAGISFVLLGYQLIGTIGSFALGTLASYGLSFYFLKFIFTKTDSDNKSQLDHIRNFSRGIWPILIGNIAINILGNADVIVAKSKLESEMAGQYGALYVVSRIIFFTTSVLAVALFSMSSEEKHRGRENLGLLRNAFFILIPLLAFSSAIFAIFPEFIIKLLFGSKYLSTAGYLGSFAIAASLFSINNLIFQFMASLKKYRFLYFLLILSFFSSGILMFSEATISAILTTNIFIQTAILLAGLGGVWIIKISHLSAPAGEAG